MRNVAKHRMISGKIAKVVLSIFNWMYRSPLAIDTLFNSSRSSLFEKISKKYANGFHYLHPATTSKERRMYLKGCNCGRDGIREENFSLGTKMYIKRETLNPEGSLS